MKTRLMKALVNLKSQLKRTEKYQKEIPTENAQDEDDSKDILTNDTGKIQGSYISEESQRVLEEWKNGKIICGKWNIFQDDDAKLK